MTFKVHLG